MKRLIAIAILAALAPLSALTAAPIQVVATTAEEKLNANVILQATEAMNRHDVAAYVAYFSEDMENFGKDVGRQGIRRRIEDIFTTFPDYRHEIIELVAKGDTVVIRNKASGTHRGIGKFALNGGMLIGIAPTEKHFEIQHIHWFKLRDGKIVNHTANRDDLGMMQQLGLLPKVLPAK